MLTDIEWEKIKEGLKKSLENTFRKANIDHSFEFDEVLNIFRGLLERDLLKEDSNLEELNDRQDIGKALKIRFIDKNSGNYSIALTIFVIKIESFFKRLYRIVGQSLYSNEKNMLKGQIVTFVKSFKDSSDSDFKLADTTVFEKPKQEFIAKDINEKPSYKPEYFENKFPFGRQFKITYDIRNSETHLDPDLDEETTTVYIKDVLVVYIWAVIKYREKLSKLILHKPKTNFITNWNLFKTHCNNFDKRESFFLVIDKKNVPINSLAILANLQWDFIFDLDLKSDQEGLYSAFANSKYPLSLQQIVHTTDDRNKMPYFPDKTTFWYFIRGNLGQKKSIPITERYADWRTMYGRYTQDLMIEYYEKNFSNKSKRINLIILSTELETVKEIIYSVNGMSKEISINFIFANESNSSMNSIIQEINGESLNIPFSQLLEGFREMIPSINLGLEQIYLPCHTSKQQSSVILSNDDAKSIRQYFQIIHKDMLREPIDHQETSKSFYQGNTISWQEIANNLDVTRTITNDIVNSIQTWLKSRTDSDMFQIIHYPGSGGTTIARRIAFQVYLEFPVLFLNETINSYDENRIVEKILQVFQTTDLPSLVIIDNVNITRQQVDNLLRITQYKLAKAIFLIIESGFSPPKQEDKRFYLPKSLDKKEIPRFVDKFSEQFPDKKKEFWSIASEDNYSLLTPFYFGLMAFEEKHLNIEKYVAIRLADMSDLEKKLLLLLAFCQAYAKGKLREVPHFVISSFLEIDEKFLILNKRFHNPRIYDLILETEPLRWRTIHSSIAEEILKQFLGTNDSNELNPFKLKEFSLKLIESLRTITNQRNSEVLELLHSLFILRNEENQLNDNEENEKDFNSESFNPKLFSKLIHDLTNNNNRIEIFENLTNQFPDENAHFWGHFARLYSINLDLQKAISAIDKALEIERDNFIFYHIKGMCYRMELYRLKSEYFGREDLPLDILNSIQDYFKKATEGFSIARDKDPTKEHGYIAFVQMCIQMLDFGFSISNFSKERRDYTGFITAPSNGYYRNILMEANQIISDYKQNNQEFESPKVTEKRLLLLKYFGEKNQMIDSWNRLLGNKSFDQNLIRRQLSYAYLARKNFDWAKIEKREIERIQTLISENLTDNIDIRDLQLWFDVSRRLNVNTGVLINKLEEWEFKKPSSLTAYYLMCLYVIQAILGSNSAIVNSEKYQKKIKDRMKLPYNRIFCPEWIGITDSTISLLNNKAIGKWSKERQFFEEQPKDLYKLHGRVVKYIKQGEGYIEIENCGILVFYQPARFNHTSIDADRRTKVEFFIGFNYDGVRGFEIKTLKNR